MRTDHAALRWLKSFKEPEGQVARWIEVLDTYDYELIHRPGKKHLNADAMSRGPCQQCGGEHSGEKIRRGRKETVKKVQTRSRATTDSSANSWLQTLTFDLDDVRGWQRSDPVLSMVQDWLHKKKRPKFEEISAEGRDVKFYWGQFSSLKMVDGVMVRILKRDKMGPKQQVLIPYEMRSLVLQHCHEARTAGHLGRNKTLSNVKRRFLWPGMRTDTEIFVRTCELCARYKTSGKNRRAAMKTFQVGEPMERLCIDIAGPFNESPAGNKYCLIITDWFTKFVEIHPMKNQEAETVARIIADKFVSRYGVPREIHTDQGTQFESQLFQELCALLGINKTRTTSFHPQSDGQSERNIKTLVKMLAIAADQKKEWDEHLPYISMAYRATIQESTGFSPNFLMFGRELSMPIDILMPKTEGETQTQGEFARKMRDRLNYAYSLARTTLRRSVERQKRLYNQRMYGQPIQKGDIVWAAIKLRKKGVSPKLQPKWRGPCLVTEVYNDVVVKVQLTPKKASNLHVDLLKPCHVKRWPAWLRKQRKKLQLQVHVDPKEISAK